MKLLYLALDHPRHATAILAGLAFPAAVILGARAFRAAVEAAIDRTAGAS